MQETDSVPENLPGEYGVASPIMVLWVAKNLALPQFDENVQLGYLVPIEFINAELKRSGWVRQFRIERSLAAGELQVWNYPQTQDKLVVPIFSPCGTADARAVVEAIVRLADLRGIPFHVQVLALFVHAAFPKADDLKAYRNGLVSRHIDSMTSLKHRLKKRETATLWPEAQIELLILQAILA